MLIDDYDRIYKEGACIDKPPAWFHPTVGGNKLAQLAYQVCNTCPVKMECRMMAIEIPIKDGIYGGMNYKDRLKYAKSIGYKHVNKKNYLERWFNNEDIA